MFRPGFAVLLLVLVFAALPGPAEAQNRLFFHEAPSPGFSREAVSTGDVDGDGVADLALGGAGFVRVLSGSDGRILFHLLPPGTEEPGFGRAVCGPGDLDGDGRAEVLVGSPDGGGPGRVFAFRGRDGRLLFQLRGDRPGDHFGAALAPTGDLDADGVPDFVVGAPGHDALGAGTGQIRVFSGKTRKPFFFFPGRKGGDRFGASLAGCGDLDGDRVPDLLAGAPPGGYVRVLSPGRGGLLFDLAIPGGPSGFGSSVAGFGDLNGDGTPDFGVGAPDLLSPPEGSGGVLLFSGRDGKVLRSLTGTSGVQLLRRARGSATSRTYGWSLSAAGDVNRDGHADFLVGDPFDSMRGIGAGLVTLVSGKEGALLFRWAGEGAGRGFGHRVLGGVDLDRDGIPDPGAAAWFGGYVDFFSGKDGTRILRLTGKAADFFGSSLAFLGDASRDGVPEIGVASEGQTSSKGRVQVFSGKDGKELFRVTGLVAGDAFGSSLALLGDLDGDGCEDFLVGARGSPSGIGYAGVFSGKDGRRLLMVKGSLVGEAFGSSLAAAGDQDLDGRPDLWVGSPAASQGRGKASLFSGASGRLLRTLAGSQAGEGFASALFRAGDLDRDGREDLWVGSPMSPHALQPGAGRIRLFSGGKGSVLFSRDGGKGESLGFALAGVGDLDGDGIGEVAAAALHGNGGRGSLLLLRAGNPRPRLGASLHAAGDWNGDGVGEVLAGAPGGDRVHLYSGKDGKELLRVEGRSLGTSIGVSDFNADGVEDWILGAGEAGVLVWSSKPPSLWTELQALPLGKGGTQALNLAAGKVHAGKLYLVLGSLSGIRPGLPLGGRHLPLNPDAYLLHTLGQPAGPPLRAALGYLDKEGRARAEFVLPPGLPPSWAGLSFHHAYLVLGFFFDLDLASNAAPLRIDR